MYNDHEMNKYTNRVVVLISEITNINITLKKDNTWFTFQRIRIPTQLLFEDIPRVLIKEVPFENLIDR
jgi:hypothetical protein